MQIRVLRYVPSTSPLVQAFVDVLVDDWLQFNGLNLNRNGTLRSAQLTWRDEKRRFRDAVEIPDADLRQLVIEEILAAIQAHIQTLPPEQRVKPVKVPVEITKPEPLNRPKPVPPPARLLVARGGGNS